MKIISSIFSVFILILVTTNPLLSQGGSNYSIFGLGDIYSSVGAYYSGIGGTSIAFPSNNSINTCNPALWSTITTTRIKVGYLFNQHVNVTDQTSLNQNNGKVDGIFGIFAIDTSIGASASFGILPYSSVNYLISSPVSVTTDGIEITGTTSYQGSGGLSTAYIGGSIRLFDNLAIGASGFLTFGFIKSSVETTLDDVYSYTTSTQKNDNFSGAGFRVGLYYSGIKNFGIGAFLEKQLPSNFDSEITYLSSLIGDTSFTQTLPITLPSSYGLGVSYHSGKFMFGADALIKDFTNFNYQGGPKTKFRNSKQLNLGLSRIGNISPGAEYLDKITYNFGFSYQSLYYTIAGVDIDDYSGSFGVELPIMGTAILDAAVTIGTRGTSSNGLIREYYGRLNVDISIGEIWFKPLKREY